MYFRESHWTSADIQNYVPKMQAIPVPRRLYLELHGDYQYYFEPHVVAIGALPEVAKVKGTVALMRGTETVDANTHLKVKMPFIQIKWWTSKQLSKQHGLPMAPSPWMYPKDSILIISNQMERRRNQTTSCR